ncbi:hypothetical protein D3A96_10860, partial [Robertkochia marina]
MAIHLRKILLLSLRGFGILGKFILTIVVTRNISVEFQGGVGLLNSTITILVLIFGLDFYNYSNKQLVSSNKTPAFILKNNFLILLVAYLLLSPLLFIFFQSYFKEGLNSNLNFWLFLFVILFEHIGQEFFRFFIALGKSFTANILLFLRTGIWPICFSSYVMFTSNPVNLNTLLKFWLIFCLLNLIFSILIFPTFRKIVEERIDLNWIKKGLKVSGLMLMATFCLKLLEYADRYFLEYFYTLKDVGIYTFYFQIANIYNVIVFTLIISFVYPKIILVAKEGTLENIINEIVKNQKSTLLLFLLLNLLFILVIPVLLNFMQRPELEGNQWVLYGLLIGNLFLNLGYYYHYLLIGWDEERTILKVTMLSTIISLLLNIILIKSIGILG